MAYYNIMVWSSKIEQQAVSYSNIMICARRVADYGDNTLYSKLNTQRHTQADHAGHMPVVWQQTASRASYDVS